MFENRVVLKQTDAQPYCMPCLEEDHKPKSREDIIREAEEIQRQAYEEGFAAGEKAGLAEGGRKADILIERLGQIIRDITDFRENLAGNIEKQVLDLSVAIAQKIIVEEISMRPEIIVTMVKEALKKLQRMGTITIKINPALHELFIQKKQELSDIHEDIVFDVSSNVSITGPLVISSTEEVVTDIDSLMSNIIHDMNNAGTHRRETGRSES